jgi:hypothetical protein
VTVDDLDDDIDDAAATLGDSVAVDLDRETQQELATLLAVFDGDPKELLRRGVHELFRRTVDTGDLDFQLRRSYDLTYDEYLAGVSYEEMAGGPDPRPNDDRRYQH